jgi:acetyl-CoA carboxylase beta subunit
MRNPHKPKKIKYPKAPKRSASVEVWERYYERIKEIDKLNAQRMAEYNRKLKQIEADKKKKEALIHKISSLRAKH